jgi:hypothetical protein
VLTSQQANFAAQMVLSARASGHPWPGYAAAECSLESGWGTSGLAVRDKDVFGLKAPSWWTGQVEEIQTREVLNGVSVMVPAQWPVFASYADAFAARLKVLQSMPGTYGEALAAQNGPEFIRLVSASWLTGDALPIGPAHPVFTFPSGTYQFAAGKWSTAPNRASEVLATYQSHVEIFGA